MKRPPTLFSVLVIALSCFVISGSLSLLATVDVRAALLTGGGLIGICVLVAKAMKEFGS